MKLEDLVRAIENNINVIYNSINKSNGNFIYLLNLLNINLYEIVDNSDSFKIVISESINLFSSK